MRIYKIIIIGIILIITTLAILYLGKQFILARFKTFLINKIESATQKGIKIDDIGYMPLRGIHLAGITLYKDKLYKEKEFYIPTLYIKFPILRLLKDRIFAPTVTVYSLGSKDLSIDGSFTFSINLTKRIETAENILEALQNVQLSGLSVKTALLNITDIKGSVSVSPKTIKTADMSFVLNGEPSTLSFEAINPFEELSSRLEISSSRFNLKSDVKKEEEIYKISELRGNFLNSSFSFMGEFESLKNPVLSLYGKADVDLGDILRFAPGESKETLEAFNPEGKVSNSIYFKGNLKNISASELGIKSESERLKISNFIIDKFAMDTRIKDGVVNIPLLTAYPYNGLFASTIQLDFTDELMPYQARGKLSNIDIAALFKNTELDNKGIEGHLFSEFAVEGDAKNISSMEGSGKIFISDANLGPMPLLTPLLGNLYGYFQHIFPELKKIYITRGSCNFYIANKKVSTNNLVLWGDVISIRAKGYVDFDKNLDFEVENQIIEPEKTEEGDWQARLQEIIVRFGKLMSKARLTGTLKSPRWKFEYLGGIQDVIKGEVGRVLKDIFE